MMKRWQKAIGGGALLCGALQLVPCSGTNPPVTADLEAPADVKAVLRRACYDCHSNETTWPWYSRVAPGSWLVVHDVEDGRRHLNFSSWGDLPAKKRNKKRGEVGEEVGDGEMPPGLYTPLHPEGKLSEDEVALLRRWADAAEPE